MLELALVFQPVDSAMIEFDIEESLYFDNQNRLPMIALDCESFHLDDISILIDDMLIDFAEMSGETFNRSESLLEAYSWDINTLSLHDALPISSRWNDSQSKANIGNLFWLSKYNDSSISNSIIALSTRN